MSPPASGARHGLVNLARWATQHPEFGQAIQQANEVFNSRVERALAERAIGFYADKFVWRATTKEEQDNGKSEYVLEPTERVYYPPDVTVDEIDT
jgi:hypothetical protein